MGELPQWTCLLKNYYVVIRVDGRNKTIRRRYYRKVQKEKLLLAEAGQCQECIRLVCRYLSAKRLTKSLKCCKLNHTQLNLNFT